MPETWYGICKVHQDLTVKEVEVEMVHNGTLHPTKEAQAKSYCFNSWLKINGDYEAWFQTREEAVAAKLEMLENHLRYHDGQADDIRNLIAEFKVRENV